MIYLIVLTIYYIVYRYNHLLNRFNHLLHIWPEIGTYQSTESTERKGLPEDYM